MNEILETNTTINTMTELIFILDKSGSMSNLTSDTIGGFNSLLKKHKEESTNAYVTTVLFNNKLTRLHDRLKIQDIPLLNNSDYIATGTTALLDAIGETIEHIKSIHKYIRSEDIPNKTLFIITTDGIENSSQKFTLDQIKNMIEEQQSKNNWEFIFLGANIDAAETAESMGIKNENSANYNHDSLGSEILFQSVMEESLNYCKCAESPKISKKWKEKIDNDFFNRSIKENQTNKKEKQ